MRELAKAVGYSSANLYHVFHDVHDIMLSVEGDLLDRLTARLRSSTSGVVASHQVLPLTRAYVQFAGESFRLWELLHSHRLPGRMRTDKFAPILECFEDALFAISSRADTGDVKRGAQVVWAGVHSIASLGAMTKVGPSLGLEITEMAEDFVTNYLSGFDI